MAGTDISSVESKHLPQILEIYNYYIQNSTATFHLERESLSEVTAVWNSIVREQHLPYIAALDVDNEGRMLGYAYAKQFHLRPAYAATVEITVYLDIQATGRGIGPTLLRTLLDRLKEVPESKERPHGVREIIAATANDDRHPMSIGKFYASEGFEKAATLKKVGFKFDRWIDVVYWQKSLGKGD